ncbi:MAG TPA: hypothetical protein VGR06_39520 [Actinophytocola sp.]|jgi:hypothetical protein|uniref:hypothetical protein n=1 Tax=Actinophytocola sp. TaxID=1872138 RepID=UPI002E010B52|nr:hypothetical protein [Actinophytocola sp.]
MPTTPDSTGRYIDLARHVVDDGGRTRRAAVLILILAVSTALTLGTLVAAYLLTGLTGPAVLGGATTAGAASRLLIARRRRNRRA